MIIFKVIISKKVIITLTSYISLQQAFQNTNCSLLPSTVTSSTTADQCSHIGIKRAVIGSHRCYNKTGEDYRGTLSIGSTGESCVTWPESMVSEVSF